MNRAELIQRGQKIYDELLKADLERTHLNEFVAIEPESGFHFLGPTLSDAAAAARAVFPDRRTYVLRIGHRVTVEIGVFHK